MRNDANRKVNCEAANINKTVSASVKQMEDIRYLETRQVLEGFAPESGTDCKAQAGKPGCLSEGAWRDAGAPRG